LKKTGDRTAKNGGGKVQLREGGKQKGVFIYSLLSRSPLGNNSFRRRRREKVGGRKVRKERKDHSNIERRDQAILPRKKTHRRGRKGEGPSGREGGALNEGREKKKEAGSLSFQKG